METVSVVTRGTSPTPSSQSSYHRTRRTDLAREIQKEITRPKKRGEMVDKEIQSDRMDDTARYSRFSSTSTMSAGPWSSYLDLKYNSPRSNYSSTGSRYSRYSKDSSPTSNRTDDNISDIKNDSDVSKSESISLDLSLENSSSKSKASVGSDKGSNESLNSKASKKSVSNNNNNSNKSDSKVKDIISNNKKSSPPSTRSNKSKSPPLSTPISSCRSPTPLSSTPLSPTPLSPIPRSPTPLSQQSPRSPTPLSSASISNTPLSSVTSLSTDSSSKSKSPPKTKQGSPENKKLLPPLPKGESPVKTNSCHSLSTPNKDFRKSVLNMADNKHLKKSSKRSNSVSSDSDPSTASISEAGTDSTTISTNKLSTSQSLSKIKSSSSLSKLPQKIEKSASDRARRSKTRSPSVGSSSDSNNSSSDDDTQKSSQKKKLAQSTNSSRTSMILSADELSLDKPSKPPPSPRTREGPKTEAEAKSFLMRALAPVTNFFKMRQDSGEKLNQVDNPPENIITNDSNRNEPTKSDSRKSPKIDKEEKRKQYIKRIESGERAWWLDENSEVPEGVQKFTITCTQDGDLDTGKKLYKFVKQDSGESPWWLNENGEVPEGVEKYPSGNLSPKNNSKNNSRNASKRNSPEYKEKSPENKSEFTQPYRIRHIDSGERPWWMNSNDNIPGENKTKDESKDKISRFNQMWRQQSGEKAWWLMSNPNIPDGIKKLSSSDTDSDDSDKNDEPLGDRASPEGLETPQTETGRLSPYDNVPTQERQKPKRPTHLFISRHTNIDDILGGSHQLLSPLMDRIMIYQEMAAECEEVDPAQVKIHDSTAKRPIIQPNRM